MFIENFRFRLIRRFKVSFVKYSKITLNSFGILEAPSSLKLFLRAWKISPRFRQLTWKNEFREIIDYLMLDNPLSDDPKNQISLLIPCHPKDFDLLKKCIQGAQQNIEDQILEIVIVSPVKLDIREIRSTIPIRVLLDTDVVNQDLVAKIKSAFPDGQHSWVLQQIVKISAALELDKEFLLVLDSDTVLTRPRTFVGKNTQLLSISYEYHPMYIQHYESFIPSHDSGGISFVTHHQLWQREVIREIWSGEKLNLWLDSANARLPNSISEYHTYGAYLLNKYPEKITWARWGNKPISKREHTDSALSSILDSIPRWVRPNSISIHDYS